MKYQLPLRALQDVVVGKKREVDGLDKTVVFGHAKDEEGAHQLPKSEDDVKPKYTGEAGFAWSVVRPLWIMTV